jgi:DNA end-binding protein Ku
VRASKIDPVNFDRTYYLGAGKDGADAYRLLHDALARSERLGIGRWVFHNREYLAGIRAAGDGLVLHTMRFADELVDPETLDLPKPSRTPTKREIDMASTLVETLHDRFAPQAFQNGYRQRVLIAVDRLAELRPGQRPGQPGHRGARPRSAFPPAPRRGRGSDRRAAVVLEGAQGGPLRGDHPRLRG